MNIELYTNTVLLLTIISHQLSAVVNVSDYNLSIHLVIVLGLESVPVGIMVLNTRASILLTGKDILSAQTTLRVDEHTHLL